MGGTSGGGENVTTEHVEVERKFDVDQSFVLPDLSAVDGVGSIEGPEERLLEAVYQDAADLRLARARVTLRRRTGGPDAGWHLKLPSIDGARLELHAPLGRGRTKPPAQLLAPVVGILRGSTPRPVATLQTRRLVTTLRGDDGAVLAEIADDHVVATALAEGPDQPATTLNWREVEVELVDGRPPLLDAVGAALTAAGARPSGSASKLQRVLEERLAAVDGAGSRVPRKKPTAGDVVLAALRAQIADLQDADLRIRTDRPDGVHQMRIACRRLRSTLAAFRPVLDRSRTEPVRDELRWLGGELSEARDGEVALEHLRSVVAAQPVELVLGPVAARMQQEEIKQVEAGRERSIRTLGDKRYLALLDTLNGFLTEPPLTPQAGRPAGPVLRSALRRSGKRLLQRTAAAQDGSIERLHDVRKAAKRVRYTAEIARPVLGAPVNRLRKRMKAVHQALGEMADTVPTRQWALRLGVAAHAAGENAWTYGRLHALEEARAERTVAAFRAQEPQLPRVIRKATGKS